MKTLEELEELLLKELKEYSNNQIESSQIENYNQFTGDSSVLLTSILEEHLLERDDWNMLKWLDDCLLKDIKIVGNLYTIEGIVIWGKKGTMKQWTDPFSFQIEMGKNKSFVWYKYLFADLNFPEITYEKFNENRNYWNQYDREWRYILHKKKNQET